MDSRSKKRYFEVASALSRDEFIRIYRESLLLSQLLFAPFGISDVALEVLSESECIDIYTAMFQQVENVVSKRLFTVKQHEEDRIVASMSKYVMGGEQSNTGLDAKPDLEILREMQAASEGIKQMLRPPRVVEFVDECGCSTTAETAALLLNRVILSVTNALYDEKLDPAHLDSSEARESIGAVDTILKAQLGVELALEDTSCPARLFSTQPMLQHNSIRTVGSVQQALDSIRAVPLDELLVANGVNILTEHMDRVVAFSILQYHSLLDIHGNSEPVQEVLRRYCDFETQLHLPPTIDRLRDGAYLRHLNLSLVPIVAFVAQLRALEEASAAVIYPDSGNASEKSYERSKFIDVAQQQRCNQAISFARMAVTKCKEARDAAVIGDVGAAVELLSHELLDVFSKDSYCEAGFLLPVQFRVLLLTERASFGLEVGSFEAALNDVEEAIACDRFCSSAYSIRSQLLLNQQEKSDPDAVEGGEGDDSLSEEVMRAAAGDALLAFLLDGAVDLNLAAAAEDVARKLCQTDAKRIFNDRLRQDCNGAVRECSETIKSLDNFPRSWLVSSYFMAYDLLSAALGLYYDNIDMRMAVLCTSELESHLYDTNDIDDNDDAILILPPPPTHLLQADLDERYANCADRNSIAYLLLVVVVDLLESVTFVRIETLQDRQLMTSNLHGDELSVPLQHRVITANDLQSNSHSRLEGIAAMLQRLQNVVDESACIESLALQEYANIETIDSGVCNVADEVSNSMDETTPPCVHYSLILALLRGEASKWLQDSSEKGTKLFNYLQDRFGNSAIDALSQLTPASVCDITGVSFSADGAIVSIRNGDNSSETVEDTSDCKVIVSPQLRARLMNISGSLAYLAGDAVGAVQCFKESISRDPQLLDSLIKLGSLLVDMDEIAEAEGLLLQAHKLAPSCASILLHLAELEIHRSRFDEALTFLRKGVRLTDAGSLPVDYNEACGFRARYFHKLVALQKISGNKCNTQNNSCSDRHQNVHPPHVELEMRYHAAAIEAEANVLSLLGVTLFRANPMRPEISLETLRRAVQKFGTREHPTPILLLCCGEVYSQAGDAVQALDCFRKAHMLAPDNPLSLVNAARTYQQLGHLHLAQQHLQAAQRLDPAMAMVRVDLAQNMLLSGQVAQALKQIDDALFLAKQVSEIKDVLTARVVAEMQKEFEEKKMYIPPNPPRQLH